MYYLLVANPEGVIFEGQVHALIAPGKAGSMEILTNHAPMITLLKPGQLEVTDKDNHKHQWKIERGYLKFSKNQAVVLVR